MSDAMKRRRQRKKSAFKAKKAANARKRLGQAGLGWLLRGKKK